MPLTEREAKNRRPRTGNQGLYSPWVVGVGGGEGDRQDLGVAVQVRTREARNKGHISLFYDRNWSPGEQLRGRGRVRLVSQGKPGQPGLDSSEAVFCIPLGTSLPLLSAETWGGGTSRRAQSSTNFRKTRLPMILGRQELLGMCMWQEGGGLG